VESEGKPAVEVVLTVLHAGGTFGGGGYSVSGGLHGVGVSVVNALSKKLEVEVRRNQSVYRQSYVSGVPQAELSKDEAADHTGTTVTFWADEDIFETTTYDFTTLARRFQEMAFLNKGLTLELTDERLVVDTPANAGSDTEVTGAIEFVAPAEEADRVRKVRYHYEGGIADFVEHINASKGASHQHIIYFEAEAEDKQMFAKSKFKQIDIARSSIVCLAGSVAECLEFGVASGSNPADVSLLNELMNSVVNIEVKGKYRHDLLRPFIKVIIYAIT
jgi:DNA gyrase subunit B